MITYINSENSLDYTVLFNKASTKLGLVPIVEETRNPETLEVTKTYYKMVSTPSGWEKVLCSAEEIDEAGNLLVDDGNGGKKISTGISSLNEYFQHIRDLAGLAIGNGRSGSDPYFLRLPLDEPYFEINANTRGITVPGELSQIGVIGDKLAEIVFFRIDRYYDAVDLNTREIYIEWELPDGTKGISRDFLRDVQSEKDKIIFGWLIGEELTKQIGTIRFAVRFVEWMEGRDDATDRDTAINGTQMLYSFSSLPATVSIVDSLHYSLFEDDEALEVYSSQTEDNVGTMNLYLVDSEPDVDDGTIVKADKPVYVLDLDNNQYTLATPIEGKVGEYKINLVNGALKLIVEATSSDGGNMSYIFGRTPHTADEGTGVKATGTIGQTAHIELIPAEGELLENPNRPIFHKLANNSYEAVSKEYIADHGDEEYFQKVATYTATQPGHYYAIAENRVAGKKPHELPSSMFYIPWAAKPVATEAKRMVEDNGAKKYVLNKTLYTKSVDTETPQTGDNPTSNIIYTKGEAGPATLTLDPVFTASDNGSTDSFTYTWYKNPDNHAQFTLADFDRPDGLSDEEWDEREIAMFNEKNWEPILGATGATLEVTNPGCYAVKVTNSFNNDRTTSDLFAGGVARVTFTPEEVVIANWAEVRDNPSAAETVTIPNLKVRVHDFDEIRYTWHMITDDNTDEDAVASSFMANATGTVNMRLVETDEDTYYEGEILVRPLKAGLYYLVLENTLNGVTSYVNTARQYGKIRVSAAA